MFVKHYTSNHMIAPKDNRGIIKILWNLSKSMPNIVILAQAVLQVFCSWGLKRGTIQSNIHSILYSLAPLGCNVLNFVKLVSDMLCWHPCLSGNASVMGHIKFLSKFFHHVREPVTAASCEKFSHKSNNLSCTQGQDTIAIEGRF